MGITTDVAALTSARDALARGAWQDALDALARADADRCAEHLELLATAAYGAGDFEAAVTAWEDAHALHLAAGDTIEAAHAAAMVALYLMMDSGLLAPVRGWLSRVDRLLDGAAEGPVHAMRALVRMYERLMSGDMEQAEAWARQAIEAGQRHSVLPAVTMGQVALARTRIFDGYVDEGLALLDEVAVVLMSGAVDPLTTGMAYCELICAMLGLAQFDRAAEWTAAMDLWRTRGDFFGGINGRCRVHRAELLRLRGSCSEAEDEALHACEELRPWMRREYGWPLTELGTIRLRRGDLAGAEEAFQAAVVSGWEPQPGLAQLRLEQGDATAAASMIRDALDNPRNIPSKERPPNGRLSRAPLLEAQVAIALAVSDVATARDAADELADIAAFYRSRALIAAATLARGRVALALGDARAAVRECRAAVDDWCELGAPWEVAMARFALAEALRAVGEPDLAEVEARAARSGLEATDAAVPATVRDGGDASSSRADHADSPPVAVSPGARAAFRREGDMRVVEYDGARAVLRDLKGMRYLARLLAEPGREFHALDLLGVEHGTLETGTRMRQAGDLGPLVDEPARRAYRRRLAEIDDDLAEAEAMGDTARAELARADRDYLVAELSRAFGLGGRARPAGSNSERARGSVTRAVRYALARVTAEHPALAQHLERTISTGTYCVYAPDPRAPITWDT